MSKIFLGPLKQADLPAIYQRPIAPVSGGVFVASGRVALRLLIKSIGLKPGSRIALPPLICRVVVDAILKEKMAPDFVDISASDFFMKFEQDYFFKKKFDMILLPHLYGVLHPQTEEIINFARENKIPLIHDAAQSFGLTYKGKPIIEHNEGGFYSFGAGKATTAASGALVYGLDERLVKLYRLEKYKIWDPYAVHFLRQRSGANYSKILTRIQLPGFRASKIQVKAAQYVSNLVATFEVNRKRNWQFLNDTIGPDIYNFGPHRVSFFKFVIYSARKLEFDRKLAHIPTRIVPKWAVASGLPNYEKMTGYLYELSTERSLDEYKEIS